MTPNVWLKSKATVINPANLLPDSDPETPIHDGTDFTDIVCSLRPDLKDSPLPEADEVPVSYTHLTLPTNSLV